MRNIFPACCASAGKVTANSKALRVRAVIFFCIVFSSLDHLIRPCQHIRRDRQSYLLGDFQIDYKVEFFRLLDWEIDGISAFQNLIHINGGRPKGVVPAHAIAHKPAGFHILSPLVYHRESILYCQFCNLCSQVAGEGARYHHKACVSPSLNCYSECGPQILWTEHVQVLKLTPNTPAASSTSVNSCPVPALVEVPKAATRERLGTVSFRSSSRFPLSSGARVDSPVMFPPGRAKLAMKPLLTGSLSTTMTMGIVAVASLAARKSPKPVTTMTSTLRRTSSVASAARPPGFLSPRRH